MDKTLKYLYMQRLWMTKSNNFALWSSWPQRIGTLSGTFCGELWNSLTFITVIVGFVSQLSQLPASSAGYVHLSLLIQRLTRLMAVEHQVRVV